MFRLRFMIIQNVNFIQGVLKSRKFFYLYHGHHAQENPSFLTTLSVNGYSYPRLSSLLKRKCMGK